MRARDYYTILQVDPAADADVIRAAYRCLARKHHPDVGSGSAERMAILNEAWGVLRDPVRRARYDRDRAREKRTAGEVRTFAGDVVSTAPVSPPAPPAPPTGLPQRPRRPTAAQAQYDVPAQSSAAPGPWSRIDPTAAGATILDFGRYAGWSLADIARQEPDFLEWLARTAIGRKYQREIVAILAAQAPAPMTSQSKPVRRRLFF